MNRAQKITALAIPGTLVLFGLLGFSVNGTGCVLEKLGTPRSVIAQMDSTRALDGMRTATWEGFEASWTYHPDAGLDLIVTEAG